MERIASKKQMYALYEAGAFGNRLKSWPSMDAYLKSGFAKPAVLRHMDKSFQTIYGLGRAEMIKAVKRLSGRYRPEGFKVNELAQDTKLVLQGEFLSIMGIAGGGHHLHYSTLPAPMKIGLSKAPQNATGMDATRLIREKMTDYSWEDFCEARNNWPDHVIEFSIWSCNVGDRPGRNAVIWEVRDY